MNCSDEFLKVRHEVDSRVEIVVVTKTVTSALIQSILDAGAISIGENRVQEAKEKFPQIRFGSVSRHLIGHLQSNKVTVAVALFDWIQSIDSESLLIKIDGAAGRLSKRIFGLLQVNVADDSDKFGMSVTEFRRIVETGRLNQCSWVSVRGIMVIAPLDLNDSELRNFFKKSREQFEWLCRYFPHMDTLSMGMSQDYQIAIEEGATMVRIGSKIFK